VQTARTEELKMAHQSAPLSVLPDWETLYMAAILETDNTLLGERIVQVEKELNSRLAVLTIGPAHAAERKAVQGALRSLAVLKAERLGYAA
jgi:hypothetical protein